MADMLKFRKGTLAQINSATKSAGTIYIAKDEKAMYVDVSDSERIRIGDFVRVATVSDIPFPYSETAIYYVENDNALLGYKDGKWSQINGTEALVTRISNVETTVASHATDIANLKAAIGMGEDGNVEGLGGRVAVLEGVVGNASKGLVKTSADHTAELEKLNGAATVAGSVAEAKKAGTDAAQVAGQAATAAGAAQARADSAYTLAESKVTMTQVENKNYATKTEAEGYAKAVQGSTTKTIAEAVSAAATAQNAAEAANTAAGAAQAKADSAYTLAESKTTMADVEKKDYATKAIAQGYANAVQGATENTVADAMAAASAADTKAANAATAASGAQSTADQAVSDAAAALAKANEKTTMAEVEAKGYALDSDAQQYAKNVQGNTTKTVKDAIDAAAAADTKAAGAATAAQNAQTAAEARVLTTDFNSFKESNTEAINSAKAEGAEGQRLANAAQTTANEAKTAAGNNATAISGIDARVAAIEKDYLVEQDLTDAKAVLEKQIANQINAANSMTYIKGVSASSELPATAKVGDTYVVSAPFSSYFAGDLLIATGEEDEDTGEIINPTWTHVKTGYDASLEQKIVTTEDGKIQLTSLVGNNNGAITFSATGSASVDVANNTVTIGMVWEDFNES